MALRAIKKLFDHDRRYSAEEFEQLVEFDDRFELLDGRLVQKSVPGGEHSLIGMIIRDNFRDYDRTLPQSSGFMLPEVSIKIGPFDRPIPDLSFWKAERGVKIVKEAMPLPDLAVEVLSPSDLKSATDLASAMVKVQKLVEGGVLLIWVINPKAHKVDVYEGSQGYRAGPVETLRPGGNLEGKTIIPGFTLPVAELFN